MEVKRIAGENCWACSSEPAQICPVVAKEDPQVGRKSLLACLDYDNNMLFYTGSILSRERPNKILIDIGDERNTPLPLMPLSFDLALFFYLPTYSALSTSN
jgi:hypothetical protein